MMASPMRGSGASSSKVNFVGSSSQPPIVEEEGIQLKKQLEVMMKRVLKDHVAGVDQTLLRLVRNPKTQENMYTYIRNTHKARIINGEVMPRSFYPKTIQNFKNWQKESKACSSQAPTAAVPKPLSVDRSELHGMSRWF